MPKNKTPKGGNETPEEITKEIQKVWKQHNKRRNKNGMVRE
tara:strand:+ start:118 stop:240 length:123 start_codon:yes stop_codon:yes gene_type:complete